MGVRGWVFWIIVAALASALSSSPAFGQPTGPADSSATRPPGTKSYMLHGSATFVAAGKLVSTASVVDGCRTITVQRGHIRADGRIVARDAATDLVLIAADLSPLRAARLGREPETGVSVTGFGFPRYPLLATTGSFATGPVLKKPHGDASAGTVDHFLSFMAPLWMDAAGGPTLDQNGNIVGIVADGYVPDLPGSAFKHIAVAIAGRFVADFVKGAGVAVAPGAFGQTSDPTEIAEIARGVTARILCDN